MASRVSSVSLIVLIVVTFLVHFQSILMVLAVDTFLVSLAVIVGAFGIGFLLGGPEAESRRVLALGTAQRNIAAATVVATQGFELPGVLVMVVFHSLLTLIVLFSLAAILRRVTGRATVA